MSQGVSVELLSTKIRQGFPHGVTAIARERRLRVGFDDRGLAVGTRRGNDPRDREKHSDRNRPDSRSRGHEAIGPVNEGWKKGLVPDGPCFGIVYGADDRGDETNLFGFDSMI